MPGCVGPVDLSNCIEYSTAWGGTCRGDYTKRDYYVQGERRRRNPDYLPGAVKRYSPDEIKAYLEAR
ncbi:hypothetical protein G3480_24380 [Thiorhodococcus mannitoliphagus]|uniref:Uncharacterized protein n=1 Tax=Thiorhodococcus mannitoliphagus TaxID=329406 RepID=A0A6P1E4D2_9GAMM|nr:hypothetical protein [Thiorhodococcus mannitoliphagus]NEX23392.1 hypothetical protein [Thiorhodococcus mannitoliphagus]